MNNDDIASNRRDFLALAAAGAALAAAPAAQAAKARSEHLKFLEGFKFKYSQVADWPDHNGGMGLMYTLSYLLTTPVGYAAPASDVGAVLVIRHSTVPFALQDAAWAKYNLGAAFNIQDAEAKAPATRNPYYGRTLGLPPMAADAALEKLIARGVRVAVCNMALTVLSQMTAQRMGLKPEDVYNDWKASVVPGAYVVPSGVFACHAASSHGCHYLFAG